MLGIDLDWHMHQLSDGQRRRVQIMIGLVRPFKILLLDEITTSLDVCVRQDLLQWLVRESDVRGATILYATHIFDGLDEWATDLFYLNNKGECGWQGRMDELEKYQQLKRDNHPAKMLAIADHWLRKELEEQRAKNQYEKAQYAAMELDPTDRQGGYASGRNIPMEETTTQNKSTRQSTLSDMMGNAGKLNTNHKNA
ncbi:MAG: CCR4-NOT complex subunit CAF16 [Bacillariaceae sp.]|jgi:CCR4-NOT complex subunit CAF16